MQLSSEVLNARFSPYTAQSNPSEVLIFQSFSGVCRNETFAMLFILWRTLLTTFRIQIACNDLHTITALKITVKNHDEILLKKTQNKTAFAREAGPVNWWKSQLMRSQGLG